MTAPADILFVARVLTTRFVAEAFDIVQAESEEPAAAIWYDADSDRARLEWFCLSREEAEQRLSGFEATIHAHAVSGDWHAEVALLPREDWAETWKRFFHAEKVSDRVWICPSWETCAPGPGEVVVGIDPGMSFGTGQHATTRGCIAFLDRLGRDAAWLSVIDAGCGSGILASAAAKLGYGRIVAFDNDPAAVAIARTNADHNGVSKCIVFHTADVSDTPDWGPASIVVANILAPVLIENALRLLAALSTAPTSRLILAGILLDQADEVLEAFTGAGLEFVDRIDAGEWTTLCLRRSGHDGACPSKVLSGGRRSVGAPEAPP